MEDLRLSSKELDTLVEALEAWEKKDSVGRLMGSLFSSMISDKLDPEGKAKLEEQERIENEKSENETRMRKDTALLLKAKLVMMKRDQGITELVRP